MIYIYDTNNSIEFFTKYNNSYLEQYDELFMLMYIYLHRYKSIEGYVNLTIKDFLLYYNYIPNRSKERINSQIRDILNLMIEKRFIQYIDCYSKSECTTLNDINYNMMFTIQLINYEENWNPIKNFVKISYVEIDKLRKNNIKSIGKILYVYMNIKRYISCDVNDIDAVPFAYPSEDLLSQKCHYGVSSIKKYIKTLCDIKMLYVKNYGSYLRMLKGKEVIVNSNNVYALEEKYLDDNTRESLKNILKRTSGYIDGFFSFCDNLPNNKLKDNKDDYVFGEIKPDSNNDVYVFKDSAPTDIQIDEDILDESLNMYTKNNTYKNVSVPINPIKTVAIKVKSKGKVRTNPKEMNIQSYANYLYDKYSNENEKDIFIEKLSKKFPELNNYEKYYDEAKTLSKWGI